MRPSHTIRLHSAWKRMVCRPAESAGEPVSVSLPDQSLLHCDAACVTYRRSFNRPTGIGERTVVLLDCGLIPLATTAQLNGYLLESSQAGLLEITSLLRPHNDLQIVLPCERFAEAATASASLQIVDSS